VFSGAELALRIVQIAGSVDGDGRYELGD